MRDAWGRKKSPEAEEPIGLADASGDVDYVHKINVTDNEARNREEGERSWRKHWRVYHDVGDEEEGELVKERFAE